MKKLILLSLSLFALYSCKQDVNSAQGSDSKEEYKFELPTWAKNATIYEVNTRQFSPSADFAGVEAQLDRLKNMGIDILWLMPIHPISELKRKARGDLLVKDVKDHEERKKYKGSPYAVADYKAVNPDFGSMDDFKKLLAATHDRGMKLIIDWVPNHTGWDNKWIKDHPDWYTKNKEGQITDPINPDTGESWGWTDVADLDFSNREMRTAMQNAMVFWLADIGIDGFRVDVAHGIAQDFWDETTPKLMAANPNAFLLAESEVESHRNNDTYHATYGWSCHHLFNELSKGEKNAKDLDRWLDEDRKKFKNGFHMHFTSNHDENAWAGPATTRMGKGHKTLAALAATFDGMPLLYSGMEEPLTRKLEFFEVDYIGFDKYAYQDFYKTLFDLKHKNKALWNGEYGGEIQKLADHDNIYAFKREKDGDVVYGIFNLSDDAHSFTITEDINAKDVFSNQQVKWKVDTALALDAWQYYILSNK